jgi:hypothetical protein
LHTVGTFYRKKIESGSLPRAIEKVETYKKEKVKNTHNKTNK